MKEKTTSALSLACLLLPFLGACSSPHPYASHQKERNNPQPKRLEAPYEQIREPSRPENIHTETIPKSQGQEPIVIEPQLAQNNDASLLYGIAIDGREGLVLSPYAPGEGMIDVRGFPVGSKVVDPYTGKVMRVPLPANKKTPDKTETLAAPKFQSPETEKEQTQNEPTTAFPPTLE